MINRGNCQIEKSYKINIPNVATPPHVPPLSRSPKPPHASRKLDAKKYPEFSLQQRVTMLSYNDKRQSIKNEVIFINIGYTPFIERIKEERATFLKLEVHFSKYLRSQP